MSTTTVSQQHVSDEHAAIFAQFGESQEPISENRQQSSAGAEELSAPVRKRQNTTKSRPNTSDQSLAQTQFGTTILRFVGIGAALIAAMMCLKAIAPGKPTPTAATPTKTASSTQRIEDVRLGERVVGRNPIRAQADLVDPDPSTWRAISLHMAKPTGRSLWIELLRPVEWIEEHQASIGSTIFVDLHEMGAVGDAEVLAIGPCPEIQPGEGATVTGTFKHEVDADSRVIQLQIEDQPEPTTVTANHPYWSVDRQDFVPAGELRNGETVDTQQGLQHVAATTEIAYSGYLHNLETTEHVFRVGSFGTLVHNSCALTRYADDGGHHIFAKSAFKDPSGYLPGYSPGNALSIGNEELSRLGLKHLGSDSLTTTQQRLFNELAASGKANTLAEHARIARETLMEHGLDPKTAASVVRRAQNQLKKWGISAPVHIPWN
jgi:hypothetical protein